MNRWLIGAAHRSSGKTTVSIGLAAALRRRGLSVQPFKKGPDYIDPMWLGLAAGRPCRNLDLHLCERDEVVSTFARHAAAADAALVESNQALFDGLAADGSDSGAGLARALDLPVVLVLDARGMTRSVAALALGYRAFDPALRFAGVILNRVGGSRHEAKLVAALSQHTDLPVLGCIPEDKTLSIVERHLGLMPSNEQGDALRTVELIADAVEAGVDLGRLCAGARVERAGSEAGSECEGRPQRAKPAVPGSTPVAAGRAGDAASGSPADTVDAARLRIGIARDEAFGFYYADDLEALEAAGAELVPFDTLRDRRLPAVDALFIGGGFPEELAAALQANRALRAQLRDEIEAGLPVYAECGGLMYLSRSIERRGERFEMVGAIPADTVMHARAVGRGYVHLERTGDFPWESCAGSRVRAHEFHHSGLRDADPGLRYAYRVLRGHGIDGERDGIVHRNVLASYAHLRSVAGNDWPARFVAFAARIAAQRAAGEAGAHPLSPNDPPEETLHGRRDPSRR